ncbi:hypothetical protein AZE42_05766 [Rhizopogon vesiculosus]|uniref:Major facilitator superfamily (MFS) profile domain-containing protein n=1 Tax=Rhizopogon vesiculosus TaxID=180088 RepID=A0A1J8QCZ1_9AGAM|nr:hypothetical protein AZE42_05766 [Rhizopogon vesiculosus]
MPEKLLSVEAFTDSAFEDRKLQGLTNFDEAPDGGLRAWLVVAGVALVIFSTVGVNNSWGVFQAYYEENLLSNLSPSTISWIGSSQYALAWFPALAAGRLFDLGYFKIPCFAASCTLVVCMFLIAECTQYWQFFLVQGLVTGRRGFALGVTAVGSSSGSTVFPVMAQKLIPLIGFKWTIRVFGFILIATLGTANLLLQRRLPPSNVHGGLFNLKAFHNKAFTFYCTSGIASFFF